MAGIYIHVPFCKQACHYCNFHFSTKLNDIDTLVACMETEMALQQPYLQDEVVESIYFGGGTPSLLSIAQLERILNTLHKHYHIAPTVELTLEMNPDDAHTETMKQWMALGINRLSIGVQSFDETILQWMHRAHNQTQAKACIGMAQQVGLTNISADLIYGNPGQTLAQWQDDVNTLLQYNIPHISSYALTVEPNTALGKKIAIKKQTNINEAAQQAMFTSLVHMLTAYGYEHYEISNFAKPGMYSKHNRNYWRQQKYLGIGPSAHSYNITSRQWNISNNQAYVQALQQQQLPFDIEHLSQTDMFNEYVMTALRTQEGIAKNYLAHEFNDTYNAHIKQHMQKHILQHNVIETNSHYLLTASGKFFADGIAADCFMGV
jgi:oxygen-independent coproporphyrinogen III oxidase